MYSSLFEFYRPRSLRVLDGAGKGEMRVSAMTGKEGVVEAMGQTTRGINANTSDYRNQNRISGRKIVDILKRNPKKDASKYTDVSLMAPPLAQYILT